MKITVKTTLVSVEVEDQATVDKEGYTRRAVPSVLDAVKSVIEEAVKLHNEAVKGRIAEFEDITKE